MRSHIHAATTLLPVDPANQGLDVNALDEAFPVTELVMEFTVAGIDGEAVVTKEKITGEDAEFLPHLLKRIERFLGNVGYDVSLKVADDETCRIGPALQALCQQDCTA